MASFSAERLGENRSVWQRSMPRWVWISLVCVSSLLAGLSWWFGGTAVVRSDADFIPSDAVCQEALRRALEAWVAGAAAGPVAGTSPVVHVTDSTRVQQRPLLSWEIPGRVPGNAPRCYAVRLQLDQPREERRERYVVIGIDPLWVFRHEDYDLLLHWEHPMEPVSVEPSQAGSGEQQR